MSVMSEEYLNIKVEYDYELYGTKRGTNRHIRDLLGQKGHIGTSDF